MDLARGFLMGVAAQRETRAVVLQGTHTTCHLFGAFVVSFAGMKAKPAPAICSFPQQ